MSLRVSITCSRSQGSYSAERDLKASSAGPPPGSGLGLAAAREAGLSDQLRALKHLSHGLRAHPDPRTRPASRSEAGPQDGDLLLRALPLLRPFEGSFQIKAQQDGALSRGLSGQPAPVPAWRGAELGVERQRPGRPCFLLGECLPQSLQKTRPALPGRQVGFLPDDLSLPKPPRCPGGSPCGWKSSQVGMALRGGGEPWWLCCFSLKSGPASMRNRTGAPSTAGRAAFLQAGVIAVSRAGSQRLRGFNSSPRAA